MNTENATRHEQHLRDAVTSVLSRTLDKTTFVEWGTFYEGKVRDNYIRNDGTRIIISTDRVSAFDCVIGTIPFKGQVLNQLAGFWFEKTKHAVANHVISIPDPNVTIAHNCSPLPVEFVMRGYLTGVTSTSIWTHYEKGGRSFCGHTLPDGLKKHQRLPEPLLTPSTKAEKGQHDESVSRADIVSRGLLSESDFDKAAQYARTLFAIGQAFCLERGLLLVDTKYEFGKTEQGEIVIIDEMHTPDSSRFWYSESYEAQCKRGEDPRALDKEYLRRWLVEQGFRGDGAPPCLNSEVRIEAAMRYIQAFETITGQSFEPNIEQPESRIRRNVP